MTNRPLAYIIKDQKPLVIAAETAGTACRLMRERGTGSVLVVDNTKRLSGIFTGRDAVRLMTRAKDANGAVLPGNEPQSHIHQPKRQCHQCAPRHGRRELSTPAGDGNGKICGVVSLQDFKGTELAEFARRQATDSAGATLNRRLMGVNNCTKPFTLPSVKSEQQACRSMRRRKCGGCACRRRKGASQGIFTGRDAIRVIALGEDAKNLRLSSAMTKDLMTISPTCHAIEALRVMNDGGFRHLPVVEDSKILGVVTRGDFKPQEPRDDGCHHVA